MVWIFTFFFHIRIHFNISHSIHSLNILTMPTTTTTTHIITDLPPAYSPPTLPSYILSDRTADRGNYAFAIMQHNLTYNTTPPNSLPTSTSRPPSPSPGSTPSNPDPQVPRTSRAQRAALRDFHATQNPELWGRRVGHGRQARWIQGENQGFWAWLGNLLVDEDRERGVVMSAGSPWVMMGPSGLV